MFTIYLICCEFSHVVINERRYIILFGRNLRKIRNQRKLSQEELANDADIPINQIGRIERGEISTTISTLFLISKALDISIKDLFDFQYKKSDSDKN